MINDDSADEPMRVEIPRAIWCTIETKFPWARQMPNQATLFLLGYALGSYERRNNESRARADE